MERCSAAAAPRWPLRLESTAMDLRLDGKSVLITGASQGIGRATAIAFAEAGCHLHLTARNARALDDVRTCALERRQVAIEAHPMDLTQPGAVAAIAA